MIRHFFKELLEFIGVFVLLGIMAVGLLIVMPFVALHYISSYVYEKYNKSKRN